MIMKPLKRSCIEPFLNGPCIVRWKCTSADDDYAAFIPGPAKSSIEIETNGSGTDGAIALLSISPEFYFRITPAVDVDDKTGEHTDTWQPVPNSLSREPLRLEKPQIVSSDHGQLLIRVHDMNVTIEPVSQLVAIVLHTAFNYH